MKDRLGRTISYLRISVTDRCNLHCRYCMPPSGTIPVPADAVLTVREIEQVGRTAAQLGMRTIRLTGGEPLLRRDTVEIVAALAGIGGVADLSMTTNGILLAPLAAQLAAAGLQRINISLDTTDPERYAAITGGGDLQRVLEGIEAAREAGLSPIKLNCVVERSSAEPDARLVASFAHERGLEARFIRRMNLQTGEFWPVEGGRGGDCPRCDRLRVTCSGMVRPCLFSDVAFDAKTLGIEKALRVAVANKPASGQACRRHEFCAVGG